ncbi:acrylate utilization transcriptional regulator AcuR [Paraburkholderia antibiotica]|uniref:TetR family transcriptional regulator n=1 Tax=Paraburkholderia antibiotica TaxID=2728839 RepID=A0A7X9X776_9BURK|nr:TetR/AcrR family transcriptional regulator [Paraburkholderia antibiotica]NML32761.1 TetR family transcriptional regulator [Paraburkholderia antibiotica]
MDTPTAKPRRGRPPKDPRVHGATRATLIRAGMALLTEQTFAATGLDTILKRVGIPKGSFYHYFESKEAFGRELMTAYDEYFCSKLDHWLLDDTRPALERLATFVDDAKDGMARHGFTRGCLIGNLGVEVDMLPSDFRASLERIFEGWQARVAACLREAQIEGTIAPNADLAALSECFWIGWEGAVLRARLVRSAAPLEKFFHGFITGLPLISQR